MQAALGPMRHRRPRHRTPHRLREPLSPREVADSIGMTPSRLTTVVHRRTGRTVGEWITERRLTEAGRLLTGTDLQVALSTAESACPAPATPPACSAPPTAPPRASDNARLASTGA